MLVGEKALGAAALCFGSDHSCNKLTVSGPQSWPKQVQIRQLERAATLLGSTMASVWCLAIPLTRTLPRRLECLEPLRSTFARVGAQKLWAGTVTIHANAKTGAHHHGHLESIIYILKGKARMRWGEALEFVAEAGPGDFIYVPPYVPHQEINASTDDPLECVLVRSDGEAIAVNLPDVQPVEEPEEVRWIDPTHANLPSHVHTHDHDHDGDKAKAE